MRNTNSGTTLKKLWKREEVVQTLIRMGISVVLGLILPRATVYGGLSPFGIGLVSAVTGPGATFVFISTAIGYLLRGGMDVLRYLAAIIAVVGIRWSVVGFPKINRSVLFAPLLAFIGTLVTGSALLITNTRTLSEILTIVSESLLAAGFAYFSSSFLNFLLSDDPFGKNRYVQAGFIVVISVMMMALFSVELHDISVGRILSIVCILSVAQFGGVQWSAILGSVLGLTVLLAQPENVYLAPIYAFGGLLAGLFAAKGRVVSSLVFLAIFSIVYSVMQPTVTATFIIGIYELAVATVFSFFVPQSAERFVKGLVNQGHESTRDFSANKVLMSKMQEAANTLEDIGGSVDTISKQIATVSSPEIGGFYRSVTEKTCKKCTQKMLCWEKNFSDVMDSFNHLTEKLQANTSISKESMEGYLKENCLHPDQLADDIQSGYPEYLIRQSAFRRLQELRGILTDQFTNTAQILRDFSEDFATPTWENVEEEEYVRSQLKKDHILCDNILCRVGKGNKTEWELDIQGTFDAAEILEIGEDIGHWCNRSLTVVSANETGGVTHLALSEGITVEVEVSVSQQRCKGEKLCGDSYETFTDGKGNFFAVLSDGMGCGGRAAVDSAMTVGLTSRLLRAGFGYESILRIANTALLANSDDETLATLDIAAVNLYSGELELLKAGAGPSLLLSRGLVTQFHDSSLPLGILRELTFARTRDRVVNSDVLLIMSDGVSNDDIRWVEDLLRKFDTENGSVQELVNTVAQTAAKLCQNDKGDDVTVIGLKIDKIF